MFVIVPYRHFGTWVFDDEDRGLVKEPFVAGIPEMIDAMVAGIPGAANGFRLLFSAREFHGYLAKFTWTRAESGGNWYLFDDHGAEGWLCPALLKYFGTAPKEIYVKVEPVEGDV